MAVAFRNGTSNIDASTSATTVPWLVPATPTAGDIWICSASFRAGSTITISGVPGSFNLIQRVDQGSGTTVCTYVAYWYKALGTESGTLGSITLSAASKHVTITDAFSGCNTTTPVVAGSITTSTINGGQGSPKTDSAGQAAYFCNGSQGTSTVLPVSAVSGSPSPTATEDVATSGGSAATNVTGAAGYTTTQITVAPTWAGSGTGTTFAGMSFTLDVPAAPASYIRPNLSGMSQAVHRAAHYFSRVPWHEKRPSGLIVPDLLRV